MKNKILIITVLLVAVLALFGMANTVKAAKTDTDLTQAISDAQDGGIITLIQGETYTLSNTVTIDKNLTIELNGATITSASQVTLKVDSDKTVKFTGDGTVQNTGGCIAIYVKGEAILEGGTYKTTNASGSYGVIQVGPADINEPGGKLTVKDGVTINGEYGIALFGDGSEVIIDGGTITAGNGFAIAGNGSQAKNTNITINDGTIESTNTAAIYQPNSGTLTINDGSITGTSAGIAVRSGDVIVNGGEITATTSGHGTIGSNSTDLPFGSAIIVDNQTEEYEDTGKVSIKGGELTSADSVDSVKSYTGSGEANSEDFEISGGEFSEKFDKSFVKEGAAEVSIEKDGETTYYVGTAAKKAVENAAEGSTVTVETGKLEVDKLPSGVKLDPETASQLTVKPKAGNDTQTIKNNLQALIEKAEKVENPSEELKNAIATAKAVLANVGSTYGEVSDALAKLQVAYNKAGEAEGNTANNNEATSGDKGKLDEEPKMGESYVVFAVIALCVVLAAIVKSRKRARR